jgi:hypothetical protein
MVFSSIYLKDWIKMNRSDESYFAYNSFINQINFLNSIIPSLFTSGYEESQKFLETSMVIGEHMSKSIKLPVVQFKLSDNTHMIVRNNFMNWKISIQSDFDIDCDFMGLFDPNEKEKSVYCEGFKDSNVLGPYCENKKEFTLSIDSTYDFYTFLYLLQNFMKKVKIK